MRAVNVIRTGSVRAAFAGRDSAPRPVGAATRIGNVMVGCAARGVAPMRAVNVTRTASVRAACAGRGNAPRPVGAATRTGNVTVEFVVRAVAPMQAVSVTRTGNVPAVSAEGGAAQRPEVSNPIVDAATQAQPSRPNASAIPGRMLRSAAEYPRPANP